MTLEDYFRSQLTRTDPHPAIDHSLRAELHADGRISFYIHAERRDSETERFWVKENTVDEKRLYREPLPEPLWKKILETTKRFGAYRSHQRDFLIVDSCYDIQTVSDWIESIGQGINAGYHSSEGGPDHDRYRVFKPCLGAEEKVTDLARLAKKHGAAAYCYIKS